MLVDEIRLRDLVWAMIDPDSAEQHVGLWLRVVGGVAPDLSSAPLALVGMASWISGNGALLNCAGEELTPAPGLLDGASAGTDQRPAGRSLPRLWQSMGGQVHDDLRGSSHGWPGEAP